MNDTATPALRLYQVLLLGLLGAAVSCQEAPSAGAAMRPAAGLGTPAPATKPCANKSGCLPVDPKISGDVVKSQDDGVATDESALADESEPPYLFNAKQANAISGVVKAYQLPDFDKTTPTSDGAFRSYESFAERFFNRVMALDALKPGRKIKFFVVPAAYSNAFADGFQQITINAPAVKNYSAQAILQTLCHEMAHSARNHAVALTKLETSGALADRMQRFYADSDRYLKNQWSESSTTYTHNLNEYSRLRKLWDDVEPTLSVTSKHIESEADIVGGMICGELGMSAANYAAGMRANDAVAERESTAAAGDSALANDLTEGEQFELGYDDLWSYLFPKDSHPTDPEREAQIVRVQSVLAKHFNPKMTLYSEWLKGNANAGGLSLVGSDAGSDPAPPSPRVVTTRSGKVLKLPPHGRGGRRERPR